MKKTLLCIVLVFAMLFLGFGAIYAEENNWGKLSEEKVTQIIGELADLHKNQFINVTKDYNILLSEDVERDLRDRSICISEMSSRIGASFVDASVEFNVKSVEYTNSGLEVIYCETTSLYYQYPNHTQSNLMIYSADHEVHISGDGIINSDLFWEELITGFFNCNPVEEPSFVSPDFENDDSSMQYPDAISYTYSAQGAINYADTYANSPNNIYPFYTGDCANFVSQCLYEGGGIPFINYGYYNTGWYHVFSNNQSSYPWCNASAFASFWQNQGYSSLAAYGSNSNMGNCIPGNPIYWISTGGSSSGHIMLCVGFNDDCVPLVDAHTPNVYHIPISYYASNHTMYTIRLVNCLHSNSHYIQYNYDNHIKACYSCGNKTLRPHQWIQYSTYYKCQQCGLIKYFTQK